MKNPSHQYVSIITTSYNYASFIADTIESIFAQTHLYWELLIIEDGSTDNSIERIQPYVEKDPRIRMLQHADQKNHGLPASVKFGVDQAQYDTLAFLESDDMWEPKSLEERLMLMNATGADVVFNQCQPIGDIKSVSRDVLGYLSCIHEIMSIYTPPFSLFECYLNTSNLIPTFSCVLVKKQVLRHCDFNPPHKSWLDYWLWSQISVFAKFAYTPQKLTLWRIHKKSYNTPNDQLFEKIWKPFYRAVCWNMANVAFKQNPFDIWRYTKPILCSIYIYITPVVHTTLQWVKPYVKSIKKLYRKVFQRLQSVLKELK